MSNQEGVRWDEGSARFDETRDLACHFCAMGPGDDADEKAETEKRSRLFRVIGQECQLPLAQDIPTKCNFRNSGGGSVRYAGLASNPDTVPYFSFVAIGPEDVSGGRHYSCGLLM